MFGFGPMSAFYDEDCEDGFNPVEPFSRDEYAVHNDRELRNLDAGRDDWDDGDDDDEDEEYEEFDCPRCGSEVRCPVGVPLARCKKCGNKF
jgi:DNA-directed RNA polymerase subunit RPC12/RpoP